MALCRHQIEREARRVLRHMGAAALEPRGDSWALVRRAGGKARLTVAADIVRAFGAEGWLVRGVDGRWAITDQGRAFALRTGAAENAFRAQHGEVADLGAGRRQEQACSALDALGRLTGPDGAPYLAAAERDAAARLEADFERAHFRPRLTMDIMAPPGRGAAHGGAAETHRASALDARRRVLAALDAAGPGIKDMLFETVCLSRGLNEAERALGWPQRAGKAVVRLGLQRLAEHYGLASGRRRPGRIEAWMASVAGAEPEAGGDG